MKNTLKLALIILSTIIALTIMCVLMVQGVQNGAINREEQISAASSDIEVQEKRRADLIPNLVDCVKQYDKHEYETLMDIVAQRGANSDDVVSEVQNVINVVAEQYPELKSNENYKTLMNELAFTENRIAEYRSNYNKTIKEYNRYVRTFPARWFLQMSGYETELYEYLKYDVSSDAPTNLFD